MRQQYEEDLEIWKSTELHNWRHCGAHYTQGWVTQRNCHRGPGSVPKHSIRDCVCKCRTVVSLQGARFSLHLPAVMPPMLRTSLSSPSISDVSTLRLCGWDCSPNGLESLARDWVLLRSAVGCWDVSGHRWVQIHVLFWPSSNTVPVQAEQSHT